MIPKKQQNIKVASKLAHQKSMKTVNQTGS